VEEPNERQVRSVGTVKYDRLARRKSRHLRFRRESYRNAHIGWLWRLSVSAEIDQAALGVGLLRQPDLSM